MIYGVPCDRPECTRVVALLDPHCCTSCRDGRPGHSERCDRVQRQWKAQERGGPLETTDHVRTHVRDP